MTQQTLILLRRADAVLAESRKLRRATLAMLNEASTRQALLILQWDADAIVRKIRALPSDDALAALRGATAVKDGAKALLLELRSR